MTAITHLALLGTSASRTAQQTVLQGWYARCDADIKWQQVTMVGKAGDDMENVSPRNYPPPRHPLLQSLLHDPVLVSAFVVCILLIGYQFTVTLLQPPWIKSVTDWLRTTLSWPEVAIVVGVAAIYISRRQRRNAVVTCCLALGLLSYAIGRTIWTIADVFVYPHGVPFPSLPDLFFILQYPCFVAALFLFYARDRWLPGVRVIVDGILWMSAVTALSWYFVLLPLSRQTREPLLSKYISMYYQVFDLVLYYGLVVALICTRLTTKKQLALFLLSVAVISLFVGDTWAALLLLHPPYTYRTGSPPDLFWFIFYVLVPLVCLVRLRFPPVAMPHHPPVPAAQLTWQDVRGGITFIAPGFAVVVAGILILLRYVATSPSPAGLSAPVYVGIALLLLALLRPAVTFLEQEQLRRERDAARTQERAWRIANARMEAFLSVAAHELNTPLTSLIGNVRLMGRRLDTLLRLVSNGEAYTATASVLRVLIDSCAQGVERLIRLVADVLDDTRVREGQLALRLDPGNLASMVGQAVTEQAALNPNRSIRWVAEESLVPVLADASRIEQVVTNYVSNALKFSRADQPVEVRVCTENGEARVSVHDNGVGIPLADQSHIWERFYQAERVEVQSGSRVGFGLGLYVSRAIVEGHTGQVGVESVPSQGTTIWFTLPLIASAASSSPEAGEGGPAPAPGEHECDP